MLAAPATPEIQDFMDTPPDLEAQHLIEELTLRSAHITQEQATTLRDLAMTRLPDDFTYGADFDFASEVTAQIRAVRAMRRSVMSDSGKVLENVSARELKEVVSASSTLLQTLLKTHEKVLSFDRQRAVERSVVEVVKRLGKDEQTLFFATLDVELGLIE